MSLGNTFTAETWVKVTGPTPNWVGIADIMNQGGASYIGWKILVSPTGTVRLDLGDSSGHLEPPLDTTQSIADGAWHFIAATYDNNTEALFIDGTQAISRVIGAGKLGQATSSLIIGDDPDAAGRKLIGDIASVNIWSSARTAQQISADMTHKLVGNESGLLASYHLDESGGTFADATGKNGAAAASGVTATDLDEFSVASGASYKGMVLGSDADHDTLSYALDANSAGASQVAMSGNTFVYTATGGAHDDTFTVNVSDGATTVAQTITVHVT